MKRPRAFKALAADMADQLDRMAFALEAILETAPKEAPYLSVTPPYPLSPHQGYAPSVERLTTEARALVDEHRRRMS